MPTTDPNPVEAALDKVQADVAAVAATAAAPLSPPASKLVPGSAPAPTPPTPADVQAVQQAAQTAQEIAGDIQAADSTLLPTQASADALTDFASLPLPPSEIHRLLAIEVPVIVQLGGRRMTVGEVMRFSVGAIIEISKGAEDELELLANNKPIGKGHAVKVGENFGIKISSIGSVKEMIRKLGGR